MFEFLSNMVGCWHRWGKWERTLVVHNWFPNTPMAGYKRICEKCGKVQLKQ